MKQSRTTPRGRRPTTPKERPAPAASPREAIAQRAYELYTAHGCTDGCDIDDWLQAEHELRNGATQHMNAD